MAHPDEKTLHHRLADCRQVARAGGCVATGLRYGVLVSLGTHPLGLWSSHDGQLQFRELASYEPKLQVDSVEAAYRATIQMLAACRSGWAESLGLTAPIGVAA